MKVSTAEQIFNLIKTDELCFAYSGSFSDSISTKIIDIARTNIDTQGKNAGIKNKVSFLMGECYQNIVRHGTNTTFITNLKERWSAFFVRSLGGTYYVTSANRIQNKDIPYLQSRLDRVNNLTLDELKELEREVLMKGEISEKGGAGLGIIMMARKTGQSLDYKFETLNSKISLFYLHVEFQECMSSDNEAVAPKVSLGEMATLHNMMVKENISILHKGDFSIDTLLPVLKMIESNLKDRFQNRFISTKLYHITVEVLQNISLHSFKKNNGICEGLFILGISGDHFYICASNFVESSKIEHLKNRLNELSQLTKAELNSLYKAKLRLVIEQNDEGIGLGLIDIYRDSKSINFQFTPCGDIALYTLAIKI
jgi:hypothetical protein